jgi:heme-degrading monooxygenase HmoA
VPVLRATTGYLGASVVDRDVDGEVEITVTTRWRRLDDIHAFAGADPEAAVVQPAARALLRSFDTRVSHRVERFRDG